MVKHTAHADTRPPHLAASLGKMAEMLEVRRDQLQYTNDKIGRNLEHSEALREISLAIASTLDVRGILNTLLDKLDSVLPKASTTIQLLNKHTGHLEAAVCHNLDERTTESKISQSGQSAVVSVKGPIVIEEPKKNLSVLSPMSYERR